MTDISIIKSMILEDAQVECISRSNNLVYRINADGKILYAKIYDSKSLHSDNECLIYDQKLTGLSKYTKRIIASKTIGERLFAIFEEEEGVRLADLLERRQCNSNISKRVVSAFIDFSNIMHAISTSGFGYLKGSFQGSHDTFMDYLWEYQHPTTRTLLSDSSTKKYAAIPYYLISKYSKLLNTCSHAVVPIDNNFHNILINRDGVKFIDPGVIVSGPIELAYGEFTAHAYGTPLYAILKEELKMNTSDEIVVRIYAILSSLNIMAFLIRNKIGSVNEARPFGNKNTFIKNILEHLSFLKEENLIEWLLTNK